MNIDIVNKQVSKATGIDEKEVALVNKFYWQRIKQHIYSYNPAPVNIPNICVIYPDMWMLKKAILYYIHRMRSLSTSRKYKAGSVKHEDMKESTQKVFRHLWQMRKQLKHTN